MILAISPHNRSESDFPVSSEGAVGARLSKFSNRFTNYSIYPLDLELDMIISSYRSAQSVTATFFRYRGQAQNLKILHGHRLYMFACLTVADFSI